MMQKNKYQILNIKGCRFGALFLLENNMQTFLEYTEKNAKPETGMYMCALYSQESLEKIKQIQSRINLKNPVQPAKIHTTVVYSTAPVSVEPVTSGLLEKAQLVDIVLWDTSYGKTVVGKLESPYLHSRWKEAMDAGASYDFPEYNPHITLSYSEDIQSVDGLKKLLTFPVDLSIIAEKASSLRKPTLKELTERVIREGFMWQALDQEKNLIGEFYLQEDALAAASGETYFIEM